tara:strand:+ start:906 stop:1637 length:732 start_codon:yes stop_codon:yes gene_type:complete
MADQALTKGERYTFGRLGSTTFIVDSTDGAEGTTRFRNHVEVTGSFYVSSNINTKGHIYGDGGTNIHDINYVYASYYLGDDNTNSWISFDEDSNETNIRNNGTERMKIVSTGHAHFDQDVIAYSSTVSDIRLKTNIRPLSSSLATICKLDGIKFDWKYRDQNNQLGLIAQQVENIVPEVVHETKLPYYASSSKYIDKKGIDRQHRDNSEYKVVRYEQLVPHLVESIKELKSEIDKLKKQLENK